MAELVKEVFGFGKPGFVIVVLVMLAVGSWLDEMITTAINKGGVTQLIRTGTQIAAILAVVGVAWKLLSKFFNFVTQGAM